MPKLGSDWLFIGLAAAAIYAVYKWTNSTTKGVSDIGNAAGSTAGALGTTVQGATQPINVITSGLTEAEQTLFRDLGSLYTRAKTESSNVFSDTIHWLKTVTPTGAGAQPTATAPKIYKSGIDYYNVAIPGVNYTAQTGSKAPNFSSITGAQLYVAPPKYTQPTIGAKAGTIFSSGAYVKSVGASGKYKTTL